MSQYYLMAQLPCLDVINDAMPLPITEEQFGRLCAQFAPGKMVKRVSALSLVPEADESSFGVRLVDDWYKAERQLRLALAVARAKKMNKEIDISNEPVSSFYTNAANTAVAMTDPMEAERFLNAFRLSMLEMLRPTDSFSDAAVYYYALRLKLLSRMHQFDEVRGQENYRNIYASIMRGGEQETE